MRTTHSTAVSHSFSIHNLFISLCCCCRGKYTGVGIQAFPSHAYLELEHWLGVLISPILGVKVFTEV
jgi:hypothetical protein